ncbi:SDR family NAD(P)-dependent oxidoreductase [Amycolatopsis vancoresmycina]|uniref:Short-chain dehydrogenase/reductase SDR n=1 Tax=Amycolatopsis vancoresmycina DSM 44592 TaxID=1292037 RepID=R1HB81_9PSEU|nr:SDR family oxidoreductase [Amycolatopsis vancoresmycina]EOD57706.1 short-chain dehydrogenase/reductase SDR [Amycolatopsis vancoresmycina DSM 44592]
MAGLGAHVVLSGRDAGRGAEVVQTIRAAGGKADFVAAELTDAASARALADRAREVGGPIDVLVNNAGIFPTGPTADFPETDFDAVFATNVKVPFYLVAALAPEMAARGHGAIVNVSTMVALRGMAGMAVYGASKAAVELMTKAWAAEYGPSGVRVNAVSPGPTRTEGTAAFGDGLDELASAGPAGRVAAPEEIAAAITFLVTQGSSFVQGAILPVDGGRAAV